MVMNIYDDVDGDEPQSLNSTYYLFYVLDLRDKFGIFNINKHQK